MSYDTIPQIADLQRDVEYLSQRYKEFKLSSVCV